MNKLEKAGVIALYVSSIILSIGIILDDVASIVAAAVAGALGSALVLWS